MKKILIIDDEAGIIEELQGFLEDEGYKVTVADSGKDGLEAIPRDKPDLILLDMKLPDMPGLDILKQAKAMLPRVKIIVITGYVDQAMFDEAERLGRDALYQKPFNILDLKGEIDRLLG